MASVFSSHPDESNIVEKIIAMNVERSAIFVGVMKKREAMGWLDASVAIAFASVELGIYQECEQNANPESSEVRFCMI